MYYLDCEDFGAVSYFVLDASDPDLSDIRFGGAPILFDNITTCLFFEDLVASLYPDYNFYVIEECA